jgi:hypothetical protein
MRLSALFALWRYNSPVTPSSRILVSSILLFSAIELGAQSPQAKKNLPSLMGRQITVTAPPMDPDGYFPTGPASICLEGPPERLCYTAAKDFGRDPEVAVIQVTKDMPAVLFSAESGGVSGFTIDFVLLRLTSKNDFQNLFFGPMSLSNQSEHVFWSEPSISDAPIFVTAESTNGPNECHICEHRYIVSAYTLQSSELVDDLFYYLDDQFMTAKKYGEDRKTDILSTEKQELLTRLRRRKAAENLEKKESH